MPHKVDDEVRPPLGGYGRYLAVVSGWCILLIGAALVLNTAGPWAGRLTASALLNWDAEHYNFIARHGYDFQRTAFFPLFPWVWRATGLGPVGISLFNLGLFAATLAALAWQFGLRLQQLLLSLALPPLLFMALPFSEAVFFVGGVAVLVGLRRQHLGLYALGLLLSCLSRSAAFVLLPAALLTAWLTRPVGSWAWRSALAATTATALGLGLSMAEHFRYTGEWGVFFRAQRLWDNKLRWPALPLYNWGGALPTRFEAPVLLLGLAAGLGLVFLLWQRRARPLPASVWGPRTFALAYVAGITVITLATKGGALVSLSRYVCATPYAVVLVAWGSGAGRLNTRQLNWALLGTELVWLIFFGAYTHIRSVLAYSGLTLAVALLLANAHENESLRRAAWWPTVLGGTALLLWQLFRFLAHDWVA